MPLGVGRFGSQGTWRASNKNEVHMIAITQLLLEYPIAACFVILATGISVAIAAEGITSGWRKRK
jgi:hypothetical protein